MESIKEPLAEYDEASKKLEKSLDAYDKSLDDFHKYCQKIIGFSGDQLDSLKELSNLAKPKGKNKNGRIN